MNTKIINLKKLMLGLLVASTFTILEARPIIEKTVDACRRNLIGQIRCNKVTQTLTPYDCPTSGDPDKKCEGWVLNCSGAGFSACAIQSDANSGIAFVDAVDQHWAVQLNEYAVNQIETGYVLSGNHSETVLMPDNTFRIYTVSWDMKVNDFGEITGKISVTCNI